MTACYRGGLENTEKCDIIIDWPHIESTKNAMFTIGMYWAAMVAPSVVYSRHHEAPLVCLPCAARYKCAFDSI